MLFGKVPVPNYGGLTRSRPYNLKTPYMAFCLPEIVPERIPKSSQPTDDLGREKNKTGACLQGLGSRDLGCSLN